MHKQVPDIRSLLNWYSIPVPEDEVEVVRIRLEIWMQMYNSIELEMGEEMDLVDPIPPVHLPEDE